MPNRIARNITLTHLGYAFLMIHHRAQCINCGVHCKVGMKLKRDTLEALEKEFAAKRRKSSPDESGKKEK